MVVRIAGKYMCLWRAVDHEGQVLEILVQRRRDKCAAVKLMRKLLRKQGFARKTVTTDKLRSYGAALQHLGFPATMTHCARSGSQVRNGLSGGGRRIRTIGLAVNETAVEKGSARNDRRLARRPGLNDPIQPIGPASPFGRAERTLSKSGTDGSNPVPSSGESANYRFPEHEELRYRAASWGHADLCSAGQA